MSCRRVRDELAAYADQALGADERERVARHLVGCPECRAELAETIRVRSLVAQGCGQVTVAPDLARRLVDIAGNESGEHLWLAAGDGCRLPSPRRRLRQRLAMGLCATTAGVLGAFGSMVLVAPGLAPVVDPDASSAAGLPGPGAATASAIPLSVDSPCPQRLTCPEELAGLRRTALLVASADRVEMVYGTGQRQVAVVEQRGVLRGQPDAAPLTAHAWQSGDVVYCVIGADDDLAREVAAALPHDRPVGTGAVDRARAGWQALAGSRR